MLGTIGKAARRTGWATGSLREVQSPLKIFQKKYETMITVLDVNLLNEWINFCLGHEQGEDAIGPLTERV